MQSSRRRNDFFGKTTRHFVCRHFSLAERSYSRGTEIGRHSHSSPYACIVIAGALSEKIGIRHYECGLFDVISNFNAEAHEDRFSTDTRIFSIEFSRSFLSSTDSERRGPSGTVAHGGRLSWLCLRLHRQFSQGRGTVLDFECLVSEILSMRESGPRGDPPKWLVHVHDAVHDVFKESFTLEDFAKIGGVHFVHLARTFRHFYGSTVGGYVRKLRLDFACRELAGSMHSLSSIAVDAGFHDQSHFTRAFVRELGLTPGKFRRVYRPD